MVKYHMISVMILPIYVTNITKLTVTYLDLLRLLCPSNQTPRSVSNSVLSFIQSGTMNTNPVERGENIWPGKKSLINLGWTGYPINSTTNAVFP